MSNEQVKFRSADEPLIFALDIGTRSVTGLVGTQNDGMFTLIDMHSVPHENRAMVDGQIEDIERVAKVAAAVKQSLVERTGDKLSRVHVAAAGRALKTVRSNFSMTLEESEVVTNETVSKLEIGGVDEAAKQLGNEGLAGFNCVGHSVLHYFLNDYKIATLVGHKGGNLRVEMIVTFLPKEVVDSLNAVVEKIGSSIETLTLEPIAAMNAVIPRELRMLNLALVDIGAGTSDIAVSSDGTVTAYTMATVAGDEISESIVNSLLVDFSTAEDIKYKLSEDCSQIQAVDILGNELLLSPQELQNTISDVVQHLADVIASAISEINEGAPRAVFLVGGGSKTPMLRELVAKSLGLDASKVAVGGNNYIKKSVLSDFDLSAPEYATPVGIAITAALHRSQHSGVVTINGNKIRTFTGQSTSIVDLLLSSGFNYDFIIGRIGKRVQCTVDGKRKFFNGGHPVPAKILLNDKVAQINDKVKSGDVINFSAAVSGKDAKPIVADVVPESIMVDVIIDGQLQTLDGMVLKNSHPADLQDSISDGDIIETTCDYRLKDLVENFSLSLPVILNGEQCDSSSQKIYSGDVITRTTKPEKLGDGIEVVLNGTSQKLQPKKEGEKHIFIDVLNYVDVKNSPKTDIVLSINGQKASFLDELKDGDVVEVLCN